MSSVRAGADGVSRCAWVGDDSEYITYHDEEWGRPLHGDRPLFEKIVLESFQAGLSWITILRRRPTFRLAFDGFDPAAIAAYGSAEVDRLLNDTGIIRNRSKIEATISNARAVLDMIESSPGALDELVWSFAPRQVRPRPTTLAEIPPSTPESVALSKALRSRGFRFVGPTTMYALMQSGGLVDDHVVGCHRAR